MPQYATPLYSFSWSVDSHKTNSSWVNPDGTAIWHPLLAKARGFLLWLAKYCGYHFAILPKFVPRFGLLPHYTTSRLTFILVCLLFIVVTIINSWCPVMVTLHRISLIRGVFYYWINRTLFVLVYHSFLTSFLRKAIIFALTEPYDVCRIIW